MRQVGRQFDQCVVATDVDVSEVLGGQATLVGDGADDGTRADVLATTDADAVGCGALAVEFDQVSALALTALTAGATIAATVAVAVETITVTVVTTATRRFLH